jgi:hypothetical protein
MKKIVIWGHPFGSHTHSYVNAGFYKAFKFLGYETHWFHDQSHPTQTKPLWEIPGEDLVVFTEGFADKQLPVVRGGTYFVHCCPNPNKYINCGARLIDTRWCDIWHKDHVYDYVLDKTKAIKIGPACYLEPKTNNKINYKNDYYNYICDDYDKFYLTWATNLLPHEFNFEDINHPRQNEINFCGNISPNGRCENYSTMKPFIDECNKNGIAFNHNDPFANPLSDEEVIRRTKSSILGVDIRGPEHLRNGYVPCRVFKNISYGHLGMTNSEEVYKELDGNCIINHDTAQLFHDGMNNRHNLSRIRDGMKYVQENHTFINRVKSMMEVVNEYK